jgi:hypothetical protein
MSLDLENIYLGVTTGDTKGDGAKTAGGKINRNFQKIKDVIENPNQIIEAKGFALAGQNVTLNADWSWRINNENFTNPVAVVLNVPLAAAGLSRYDLIVATTSNTFMRVAGVESATNIATPLLPPNTIYVERLLVNTTVTLAQTEEQSVFLGSVEPTSTPTGSGSAFWTAVKAGTYTNFGGVVVAANSMAFISRNAAGAFSVSQTALDLTGYSKVGENKISPWTAKVYASGEQVNHLGLDWVANAATVAGDVPGTSSKWVERLSGYINFSYMSNLGLNELDIYNDFSSNSIGLQSFNGGVISLDAGRLKVVASTGSKGCGINPAFMTNGAKYILSFDVDLNSLPSIKFYSKWATVLQTISVSGTYTIYFTADNSGPFPFPIFSTDVAGTFFLDNVKLIKENANSSYPSKFDFEQIKEYIPSTVNKTDFETIPSYISSYNGGVLSIDSSRLKVVSVAQQGFRITALTSDSRYSLNFYIDIGDTKGVNVYSLYPNLITTITKSGLYDITIPSASFGIVQFLTIQAGTFYLDYLNIYENVKWATENQIRVVKELADFTGGFLDTRVQVGRNAVSNDSEGVSVGGNSEATQDKSTALGFGALATFSNEYAGTASPNGENLATGAFAKALSWRAVAVGPRSIAGDTSTFAAGFGAVVNKVHGVGIGRGAYIPNISIIENGVTVVGADLSMDFYISNGWGHRFKTPPSGIAISNIVPSNTIKRYHGQDAYDELDGTDENVQGGNVALSAGRGTGTGKGGKLFLETAPVTGTKGGNQKNELVAGAAVTAETSTPTRFQLLDNETNTLKDVKYYIDANSRKVLYID